MKGNKIVLDLEFTPLRDPDLQAVAGNEIIEIGAVKLDEENRKLDSFQTYVKPQYSDIPYRITQITGITKKQWKKHRSMPRRWNSLRTGSAAMCAAGSIPGAPAIRT